MTKSIKALVKETDVVLMGAGIMSATLGVIIKELNPATTIQVFERLDEAGTESSDAWNNAGTGHSAFCELNYTPQKEDGSVDVAKAIKIAESFEVSREFWSYLVEKKYVANPGDFIRRVPHMSFVLDDDNVQFLKTRFNNMKRSPLFADMKWTDSKEEMTEWAPIVMRDRPANHRMAATRMDMGTDVNFGALTRSMFEWLGKQPGVTIHYNVEALDLDPDKKGGWDVSVRNLLSDEKGKVNTRFVFIGAGGATLHLLKRAEISERKGYGGFPVSGLWLKCQNDDLIAQHNAKVYGKASLGAPPMSVPHIDTRYIDGTKELLFGPFAGFSTKFLKNGSLLDLPKSIRPDNAINMISAGLKNVQLTKYLIEQLRLTPEDRIEALQLYVPSAKLADWELKVAGQRVQVIKEDKEKGGVLEFGTEMVVAEDGTVAALLGASPGASTAAAIIMSVLVRCFKKESQSDTWKSKLKEIAPSFGVSLSTDEKLLQATRDRTSRVLGLN